jgi:hypothetical protein
MSLSERLYRILLRAYPARYREQFGGPMADCFRDQLRTARTPLALAMLWLRTLADAAWSLPQQHLHVRFRFRPVPVDYSGTCRLAIFAAREEASSYGRREITTEDLLLGLLRKDDEIRARLGAAHVALMVQTLETRETSPRREPPQEDLRLNCAARRAHETAKFYALAEGGHTVGTSHLLRGIRAQKDTLAARLLRDRGEK